MNIFDKTTNRDVEVIISPITDKERKDIKDYQQYRFDWAAEKEGRKYK